MAKVKSALASRFARLVNLMGRAISAMLLGLFSYALIVPFVSADSRLPLPACCRRSGKHHCAMPMASSPQGTRFSVRNYHCRHFPQGTVFPSGIGAGAIRPFTALALVKIQPIHYAENEAGYRGCFGRSHQQRGPPPVSS